MAYAEKAVLTVCFFISPLHFIRHQTPTSFVSGLCLSACVFVLILDHDDESFSGDLELWLPGRSV